MGIIDGFFALSNELLKRFKKPNDMMKRKKFWRNKMM